MKSKRILCSHSIVLYGFKLKQFHLFRWFYGIAGKVFFEIFPREPGHVCQPPQMTEFDNLPAASDYCQGGIAG